MTRFSEGPEALQKDARGTAVDALTGLTGRAAGETHLAARLAVQCPTLVILIVLNGLKQINYRWGHACGDQVLKCVAHFLLAEFSSRFPLLCRWEGSKFVMAAHAMTQELEHEADVLRRFTVPAVDCPIDVDIGATAGVAVSRPGDCVRDLIRRAESGLRPDP